MQLHAAKTKMDIVCLCTMQIDESTLYVYIYVHIIIIIIHFTYYLRAYARQPARGPREAKGL